MHLIIGKADLARVIAITAKVVEARNVIPILSNLKLSASMDTGKLTITATDLDIVVTASCEANITTAGEICVDAKMLGDIARKAAGDIDISLEDEKLKVKTGRSRFSLATLPVADFPSLDGGKYDAEFNTDLAALFAPVAFAIAVKDPRHTLEGIYLHASEGRLTAVATNGHRLARHFGDAIDDFKGVIISQKPASIVGGIKGSVKISVSEEKLKIEADDFTMITKLIHGEYPDYRRVIPMSNSLIASAEKEEVLRAADRVTIVSNERGNAVKLSVAPGEIALTVHGMSGDANDEVATDYSGEPVEVGFNSIYLRDALTVFPDGPVTFSLQDSMSPARLTSVSAPDLDVTLMPMRV